MSFFVSQALSSSVTDNPAHSARLQEPPGVEEGTVAEPYAPRGEAVRPVGSPAGDHYIPGQVRPPSLNTASKGEEEEVFVCLSVFWSVCH